MSNFREIILNIIQNIQQKIDEIEENELAKNNNIINSLKKLQEELISPDEQTLDIIKNTLSDENLYQTLIFCLSGLDGSGKNLISTQKSDLVFVDKINEVFEERIRQISKKISKYSEEKKLLEKIISAIEGQYKITDDDYKSLYMWIKNNEDLSEDDKISIMIEIGFLFCYSNKNSIDEPEIVSENEHELNIEDIKALFRKYGYSEIFIDKLVSKRDSKLLIKYANLEKIDEILKSFKENSIDERVFIEFENKLILILIHSNQEIIQKLFEYIKDDVKRYQTTFVERFKYYLNFPSIFGKKKRVYQRRNTGRISGGGGNSGFYGTFDNFERNRKFLIDHNVDLKTDSIKVLQTSPELLEKNYSILLEYGFNNEMISKALTILETYTLRYVLDMCVELNILEKYIKENPSHLFNFNQVMAYRLKYCLVHKKCIDGRRNGEISHKISKQNLVFDEQGPEVDQHAVYDNQITNIVGITTPQELIEAYRTLLNCTDQPQLDIFIEGYNSKIDSSILDYKLKSNASERKRKLLGYIQTFDSLLMSNKQTNSRLNPSDKNSYGMEIDGRVMFVSRKKFLIYMNKILNTALESDNDIESSIFENFGSILKFCLQVNSILTQKEKEKIDDCVDAFIQNNFTNEYTDWRI